MRRSLEISFNGNSFLFLLIVSTLLIGHVGCSAPDWLRGKGFDGPHKDLGSDLRPTTESNQRGTGIDERARQIERNLGYQ